MDSVTLWRALGQADLDRVSAAGWKAWPAGADAVTCYTRAERAHRFARRQIVRSEGAGYVVEFDVSAQFVASLAESADGYVIPPADLERLNDNLVDAIRELADYRGAIDSEDFTKAQADLGAPLPGMWQTYLQRPSWFRKGWLPSGCFLWIYFPYEAKQVLDAWGPTAQRYPGCAPIGTDGSRDALAVDLRQKDSPVYLIDIVGEGGWESAPVQAEDLRTFIERVEIGTFDFT